MPKIKVVSHTAEEVTEGAAMMSERRSSHDSKSKSSLETRDENAVNREIATLLLNLHSSRSHEGTIPSAAKAEDLSLKSNTDTAIDLSKGKADYNGLSITKLSSNSSSQNASINGIATSIDLSSKSSSTPNYSISSASSNPYSFYPSLASMANLTPSTLATMNSNYLLQNLLLGKMQQMVSVTSTNTTTSVSTAATASSSNSSSPLSFPTQPLPAQALSLPSATNSSLKPPPSVLKSTTLPNGSTLSLSTPTSVSSLPSTLQQLSNGTPSTNIPLLCGQIVAQLNGLLFLVHSLNSSQIELSLQTQLTAIYGRLQEIVTMVEHAKKQQEEREPKNNEMIQKQLERMKESKQKEEEKIAKHIQDYQRALLQQHDSSKLVSQIAPIKETPASTNVVNLLKKQAQANIEARNDQNHSAGLVNGGETIMHQEVESTSPTVVANPATSAKRRRGRPPKNSNMDLSYSPPEKKSRNSLDHQPESTTTTQNGLGAINGAGNTLVGGDLATTVATKSNGSGKGIRNRVFCGECAGCLKNDDCGRCRYCQDKTKFGGQNRLRQKCLHRRCQMDTHRKRATNNHGNNANNHVNASGINLATNGTNGIMVTPVSSVTSSFQDTPSARQSPSPTAIYSGVDLARLAATAAAAEKLEVKADGAARILNVPVLVTSNDGKFSKNPYASVIHTT